METYHFLIFTCLLFLQEGMEGFQTTVICWLLVFIDSLLFKGVSSLGFNFYETAGLVDLVFILVTCALYSCHNNLKIITVFVVSMIINVVMLQLPTNTSYNNTLSWYKGVNIILFELLIWYCIITSRLYPYLKKLSYWVNNKLDKYMVKRFKYDH